MAPDTTAFDPALDQVSVRVPSLDMPDAFNPANSLAEGPSIPGNVGFEVVWTATGPAEPVRSTAHGFAASSGRPRPRWPGRAART